MRKPMGEILEGQCMYSMTFCLLSKLGWTPLRVYTIPTIAKLQGIGNWQIAYGEEDQVKRTSVMLSRLFGCCVVVFSIGFGLLVFYCRCFWCFWLVIASIASHLLQVDDHLVMVISLYIGFISLVYMWDWSLLRSLCRSELMLGMFS